MTKILADIGIVGAGPAGARAAELLSTLGAKVVLLDPKAPWEKPCGGGLTPSAFEEIPELEELKPRARSITRIRVETGSGEGFDVSLDRPMWVLSRQTLSQWQLARALDAGAEHLPVRVRNVHRTYGGWRLETDRGDVSTPLLVGADGAASLVRRVAAPKFKIELAPTRVAYPEGAGPAPDTALLRFFPSVAGYLWDFPRPDHRSVGIGVSNGEWKRPRLDEEIDGYRRGKEECQCAPYQRGGAVIGTAQLGHGDFSLIGRRDYALLGDAAGLADPLTGEGIQNALRSADLVVSAWAGSGTFEGYPDLARRAFDGEFRAARFLRRNAFESEIGVRLIRRSGTRVVWSSAVAAVVNSINEHDLSPFSFPVRWMKAYWAMRGYSNRAEAGQTVHSGCACGVSHGCLRVNQG